MAYEITMKGKAFLTQEHSISPLLQLINNMATNGVVSERELVELGLSSRVTNINLELLTKLDLIKQISEIRS
jgi:hypothetical protein